MKTDLTQISRQAEACTRGLKMARWN